MGQVILRVLVVVVALVGFALGCGARTGLRLPDATDGFVEFEAVEGDAQAEGGGCDLDPALHECGEPDKPCCCDGSCDGDRCAGGLCACNTVINRCVQLPIEAGDADADAGECGATFDPPCPDGGTGTLICVTCACGTVCVDHACSPGACL